MTRRLTPQQIADAVTRARRVVADHRPRIGMCPICHRHGDCDPRLLALAFLAEHDHGAGR